SLHQFANEDGKRTGDRIDFAHWFPVIGFADSMIGVSAETRNGASASKLVAWLASAEIGTQLAPAAGATFPVRRSVPLSMKTFDNDSDSVERSKFADAFTKAINGDKLVLIPRIPGIDDYLAALDRAVSRTLKEKQAAETALKNAAEDWQHITNHY